MRGQRGCRGGVTTTHMQDSSARSATIPARLIVISVPASQLMVRSSPICTEEKGKSCVSLRHGVVVDHPRFVAFGPRTGTAGETMVRTTVRREKLSEVGTMVRQATPARGVAERSRAGPVVPRDTQRASTGTRIDTGYASSIVKKCLGLVCTPMDRCGGDSRRPCGAGKVDVATGYAPAFNAESLPRSSTRTAMDVVGGTYRPELLWRAQPSGRRG